MVRLHLTFPEHLIDEPVIWAFGQEVGARFTIARAHVDATTAWVILELDADDAVISTAVEWFEARDIHVGRLPDEERR